LRRITKAALGGVAGCALVLGGTQAAVAAYELWPDGGDLIDLRPAEGPFDGASVSLQVKKSGDGTNFVLDVTGINATAVGVVYGAHLHTRACDDTTEGGLPAGPHYNDDVAYNRLPAEISSRTEVWFDLVPGADGVATDDDIVARDSTTVKFVPVDPDGIMSIVVHVAETNHKTGGAGARAACFTLDKASEWVQPPPEGL
jgi:Cu/Zn superoxide dismutase